MTKRLPAYIILINLLMVFACVLSHAQLSCSSTGKILSINGQGAGLSIDDSNLSGKINDTKNASKNSIAEHTHNITILCPKGTESCNGTCTDINTESNCGGCANTPNQGDHVCTMEQKCCNGVCCLPEEICCHGKCTDMYDDPNNCGGCSDVSPGKNICQPGEICCNGVCADTLSDHNNCGDCGNVCSEGTNCIDGECSPSSDTGKGTAGTDEESGDILKE